MQNVQLQISTEQLLEAIRQLPVKEQRKLSDQISQLPEQKRMANAMVKSKVPEVRSRPICLLASGSIRICRRKPSGDLTI